MDKEIKIYVCPNCGAYIVRSVKPPQGKVYCGQCGATDTPVAFE